MHLYIKCDNQQKTESLQKELTANKAFRPLRIFFKGSCPSLIAYLLHKNVNLRNYYDYFTACQGLGLDMSLPQNRYPHDFKRWHDIRCDEYTAQRAKQDEKERKVFYAKFAQVAAKYRSLQMDGNSGFACLIAKSPAELIYEGKKLCHCVGGMGYDQKFTREETLIFFIRVDTDLKTPFVTVEYSPKQKIVLQCYARNDTTPDKTVLDFVHKQWLPYANKQLKKIAA